MANGGYVAAYCAIFRTVDVPVILQITELVGPTIDIKVV